MNNIIIIHSKELGKKASGLKHKGHSFEDTNVLILDREDRLFERGVKEAIYVHCE